MEIAKNYFMEGQILNCVMYRYICTCSTKRKKKSSTMGFRWVSSETLTFLFPEFLWFLMMQSRITDVAGFEIRDHRKYIRKRNEIRKMLMQEKKNQQMNSGWLANVQLLPPWFLMKHFPVLDYKCIAFGILISQKTQVFVQKYELRNWNSPLYISGQKLQIFVTFYSLKY